MSLYVGAIDSTVSNVQATLTLLIVPCQYHMINTKFNHNGYFYHKNTSRLAITLPLRKIQLMSQYSVESNFFAHISRPQ